VGLVRVRVRARVGVRVRARVGVRVGDRVGVRVRVRVGVRPAAITTPLASVERCEWSWLGCGLG
jgi:hypothetical protein